MRYTDIQRTDPKHNEWLSSLDFYKEDLGILITRLNEVASKNTGKEALIDIEHFENQFEIQQQNISNLAHRIKSNEHACAVEVKQHAGKVDEEVVSEIKTIEKDMTAFENTIRNLRSDFNIFLSKWM